MRNLFLVLVLANLAFAAWAAWFAPAQHVGRSAEEGLPSITLVSEVPADLRTSGVVSEEIQAQAPTPELPEPESGAEPEQDAAAPDAAVADAAIETPAPAPEAAPPEVAPPDAAAGAAAVAVATRCTSVGPFRELSQAATAAAALR